MSKLTTWHKILMTMAIVFCLGFGIRGFLTAGATAATLFYLGAGIALVAYLAWFNTKSRRLEHAEHHAGDE